MIAIIPARGGSKGLPGKNIRPLLEKPMIAYTVEAARRSIYIDDIIVSTDDCLIADVAVQYGAMCPFFRPDELASDDALVIDSYVYTIDRLEAEYGYVIHEFAVLQPTSPLRIAEDIDNAIALFRERDADSVISCVEEDHPVQWHKYLDAECRFENIFDETLQNRQQYRKSYYPNGAVYVFRSELIRRRSYYSEKSFAYVMPPRRSVDVDSLEDFQYAECLMKSQR